MQTTKTVHSTYLVHHYRRLPTHVKYLGILGVGFVNLPIANIISVSEQLDLFSHYSWEFEIRKTKFHFIICKGPKEHLMLLF